VLDSAAHLVVKTQEMLVMLVKRVGVRRQMRLRLQLVRGHLHQRRVGVPLQLTRALRLAPRWPVLGLSGRGPTVAASVSAGVGESAGIRTDRTMIHQSSKPKHLKPILRVAFIYPWATPVTEGDGAT
jgi:hypothetical protein